MFEVGHGSIEFWPIDSIAVNVGLSGAIWFNHFNRIKIGTPLKTEQSINKENETLQQLWWYSRSVNERKE